MERTKTRVNLFLSRLIIKAKAIIMRCPRRIRIFGKPLLGGLIGLIGGIPGFFIGLLLGYLLGELFGQTFRGKKILDYLENPGTQQLNESEPGIAAWCALGVMVASENYTGFPSDSASFSDRILKQVFFEASYAFNSPLLDPSQLEHFSNLAWSKKDSINPDLLAESFFSRRSSHGDAVNLARRLDRLAKGEKAKALAREIRLMIDPSSKDEDQLNLIMPKDPWKILGLPPGTPQKEIKAHYRKLAKLFHPDNLEVLDEKHRDTAAEAFMAIKEAYLQITRSFQEPTGS